MASNHCFSGEVFSKHSDCFEVCTGVYGVAKSNRSILLDKAAYKAMDFYPNEYKISDEGKLIISPTNQFSANTFIHTNSGVTVCFPLDDCFSSHNYWLVNEENVHFLDHSRQLWIKPIRHVASFGEFYIKDNYAAVCYPKLSDTPLRLFNGILCVVSIISLCILLIHLKLRLNKSGGISVFPATLFFGYVFQSLNFLWVCPKPLLLLFEKYFFICAFLWINFQIFQLYQKVHSYSASLFFRFHSNKYLPFLVAFLPLWFERLYSCDTIDFFRDSCDFLLAYGQYLSVILDSFIMSVIILNSLVLRFVKWLLVQKQIPDSAFCEQFYMYAQLTLTGGIYITIKLITDIIAIEEATSRWFYLDAVCQSFGCLVVVLYFNRM